MFRYYLSSFNNHKSKARTARLVMNRQFDIKYSYTFEISMYGYYNEDRKTFEFN
jgi:hypothetical protein